MKITTRVNWAKNTEENREKLKQEYNSEKNKQTLKQHLQRKLSKAIEIINILEPTLEEDGDTLWANFTIEYEEAEEEEKDGVTNAHINRAMYKKNDEFYTLYEDVEKELKHYHEQLKDQIIYLPADGAEYSNFWKYLIDNYDNIKYKKIICTSVSLYNSEKTTFDGKETKTEAHHSGNFQDNIEIFKQADIVITNPPFSTLSEFFEILLNNNLKYLIVGPLTIMLRDHVFQALKAGKMKAIDVRLKRFITPTGELKQATTLWYTNLERKEEKKTNNEEKTPDLYYYNTDILYIKKLKDLKKYKEHPGIISVPITIFTNLSKYNIEIIKIQGNSELTKASEHPNLKKFLRGKEVTNNKIPPLIKNNNPRDKQHYWIDQNTGDTYTQPFARVLVKWKK